MSAPLSVVAAIAVSIVSAASPVGLRAASAVSAKTPPKSGHKGPPAAAVRLSRRGLLARVDLGTGWSQHTSAPAKADALVCASGAAARPATRNVVVATPSPTFAQASTSTFASSASYVFANASKQRQAWDAVTVSGPGRCLEKRLEQGSSRQVKLTATSVHLTSSRSMRLAGVPVTVARWQARGTATGDGQTVRVYLDGVFVRAGSWIAEDEFSRAVKAPSMPIELRAARAQAQRVAGQRRASTSTAGQVEGGFGSFS